MDNTTMAYGPTGTGYGPGTGTAVLPTKSASASPVDPGVGPGVGLGVGPGSGSPSSPVGGSLCAPGSQSTTTVYSTDLVTVTVTAAGSADIPTSMSVPNVTSYTASEAIPTDDEEIAMPSPTPISIPDVTSYTLSAATPTDAEEVETSSPTSSYSASASGQFAAEDDDSTGPETSSPASYDSSAAAVSSPVSSAISAPAVEPAEPTSTTMAPGGFYEVSETQTSTEAPSSSAEPTPLPSVPSTGSSGSKRGLAYNSATLTNAFTGSSMSWAYNWANNPDGILGKGIEFVPMLWGQKMFGGWDAAAKSAIAAGAKNMLSFNEPDLAEQANMDTATAAAAHIKYMNPYADSVRIGSPAVTNGGPKGGTDGTGLGWMQKFFDQCAGKCKVDFLAFHWYDSATNVAYFKNYVEDVIDMAKKNGVNKVWLTEFGAAGSDEQVAKFLKEVLPWMDANDAIERYAYFMCREGKLVNGKAMSALGKAYAG